MSVKHIVLSGGPGAGKTSCLEMLKALPRADKKTSLVCLDETASKIFRMFPKLHLNVSTELLQATILGTQIATHQIVEQGFENVIFLHDRAAYDVFAYTDGQKFCELTGFAPYLSLPTYDLVIYLESPDSFVGVTNNPYRKENAITAREIETKTRQVWEKASSAKNFVVIPATDSIREKAFRVAEIINAYLNSELFDLKKGVEQK